MDAEIADPSGRVCRIPMQGLWALIDGAQDPNLVPFYLDKAIPAQSLFQGPMTHSVAAVGPWLLCLENATGTFFEDWSSRFGTSVGVLLRSSEEPEMLIRHLRRCFNVQDERGESYFFRFYDPRVLHVFLESAGADQLERMFAGVEQFIAEDADASAYIDYEVTGSGPLQLQRLVLDESR